MTICRLVASVHQSNAKSYKHAHTLSESNGPRARCVFPWRKAQRYQDVLRNISCLSNFMRAGPRSGLQQGISFIISHIKKIVSMAQYEGFAKTQPQEKEEGSSASLNTRGGKDAQEERLPKHAETQTHSDDVDGGEVIPV